MQHLKKNFCDERQAVAHSTQEAAQAGSAGGGKAAKNTIKNTKLLRAKQR